MGRQKFWAGALALTTLVVATSTWGAGFGIFEQGSKAMGMAGAFTAQADDPSALFHNPAGIALQDWDEQNNWLVGFTYIGGTQADFEGANPFPGQGVTAEQEMLSETPPHLYWVKPLGQSNWTFGLGLMTPFGLTTEWENPDTFPGRFISTRAALQAFDINPTLAVRLSDNFSLGFGGFVRASSVELEQHVPFPNPFTQTISDIADLQLESDTDTGIGFNFGLLHKATDFFHWGLNYRSAVEVDYSGEAIFFQNLTGTPLDQLVPTVLPIDQEFGVETSIEFPDQASLGLAFNFSEGVVLETDFNWTGWSTFDVLPIDFEFDQFDTERVQRWEDAYNYRVGLRLGRNGENQWRFGYVYDETPQPEEAVSPLLPDANRQGFTIGYGFVGNKYTFDIAGMFLTFDEAERFRSFPEEGDFFGTYQNEAILIGASLGF